jgi:hypothetical protein
MINQKLKANPMSKFEPRTEEKKLMNRLNPRNEANKNIPRRLASIQ